VDGIIEHVVHDDDVQALTQLSAGLSVVVRIDRLRRAQLSLSHTASHLVYLGVLEVRPDAIAETLGCHIRIDTGRFDFGVKDRFTLGEVQDIERIANAYVSRRSAVLVCPHERCADARYWKCEEKIIPCGGTHILSTAPIGFLQVRRKSLGLGKERLSFNFDEAIPDIDVLHA
jgi:alanyl-tRNA synthetase